MVQAISNLTYQCLELHPIRWAGGDQDDKRGQGGQARQLASTWKTRGRGSVLTICRTYLRDFIEAQPVDGLASPEQVLVWRS